jgi:hypothetical protein
MAAKKKPMGGTLYKGSKGIQRARAESKSQNPSARNKVGAKPKSKDRPGPWDNIGRGLKTGHAVIKEVTKPIHDPLGAASDIVKGVRKDVKNRNVKGLAFQAATMLPIGRIGRGVSAFSKGVKAADKAVDTAQAGASVAAAAYKAAAKGGKAASMYRRPVNNPIFNNKTAKANALSKAASGRTGTISQATKEARQVVANQKGRAVGGVKPSPKKNPGKYSNYAK